MPKKPSKTRAQYATQYGVNARTITRWIAKGYPLDEPEKVAELESAQKNSSAARKEAGKLSVETKDLTDEQLENPRTQAEAKLFQLVLVCRRLSFNNQKERGLYALKSEVIQKVRELRAAEWAELRQKLERELPAICDGLGAAAIQRNNADALAVIARDYQAKAEKCTG